MMLRRSARGFSLLEIAIVMSIVGLFIAGLWMLAAEAESNNRRISLNRDVLQIIQNTEVMFANQASAVGSFSSQDAINAGIFPANWIFSNTLHHAFSRDKAAAATAAMANQGNNILFSVGDLTVDGGLPGDVCMDLAIKLGTTGNFQNLRFIQITVTAPGRGRVFRETDMPVTPTTAATACLSTGQNRVQVLFDPT